jgi:hypothetical protein
MSKHTTMTTGRASLCALGEYLRRPCFFAPVREQVQIGQKTVRYRPMDKLLDALSGILCGAKTIAQHNLTIRTDRAVQRAFGRTGCAEQSTIARTLRACTAENVAQLEKVSWYYLKRYGVTPHHRFHDTRLWVDIDLTPMPMGAKAEGSERTGMGRNRSKTVGKPSGSRRASSGRSSMQRCSAGKRPLSRHSKGLSRRWKRTWEGRGSTGNGLRCASMGALGALRASIGS